MRSKWSYAMAVGGAFFFAAAAGRAQDAAPSQRIAVVGCVTSTTQGALELVEMRPAGARSAGSNSAKASTPIAAAAPSAERPRTSGMVTPKGSTPIAAAPARYATPTRGANSPKASTPVNRTASAYRLDAHDPDIASHVGHIVEISGALDNQRVLKPLTVRAVAMDCGS